MKIINNNRGHTVICLCLSAETSIFIPQTTSSNRKCHLFQKLNCKSYQSLNKLISIFSVANRKLLKRKISSQERYHLCIETCKFDRLPSETALFIQLLNKILDFQQLMASFIFLRCTKHYCTKAV